MTGAHGPAASPAASPPRASRPAPSPAGTSPRCAASRTRSASTWAAPAPTSRSSTRARCASRRSGRVEYGHPICFPSIEVLTIGAGGGSLAWIDEAGSLRNGPQSAGADPGPACYQRGGEEPTNTDANVVLGRLGGELVGGAIDARRGAAADAVDRSGRRAARPATSPTRRARSSQVANANMADAVRLISIRRGYDPRDFALVAFGGAGALHGAALARELSIPTVLVPPNPGITSALGCLLVDVRHDLSEMYLRRHRRRRPGRGRGGVRRAGGRGPRSGSPHEGVAGGPHDLPAHDRDALPGPVAVAGGRRSPQGPVDIDRRSSRSSTTSTSASSPTGARTARRSRSTSSRCARSA